MNNSDDKISKTRSVFRLLFLSLEYDDENGIFEVYRKFSLPDRDFEKLVFSKDFTSLLLKSNFFKRALNDLGKDSMQDLIHIYSKMHPKVKVLEFIFDVSPESFSDETLKSYIRTFENYQFLRKKHVQFLEKIYFSRKSIKDFIDNHRVFWILPIEIFHDYKDKNYLFSISEVCSEILLKHSTGNTSDMVLECFDENGNFTRFSDLEV